MEFQPQSFSKILFFLFTDLENSTRLWEQFPLAMKEALARHDALLRRAVEESGGQVVKTTGDGLLAVFPSAFDGIRACISAQRSLLEEPWEETGPLRVRMGLHCGEAQLRAGDYYGPDVNRAARLMSVAHGGQVLLSAAAAGLVIDSLPQEIELRNLGLHRLKDLERPENIFQLIHPDLPAEFPPLASLDRRPNNLPSQTTSLIGREDELAEITDRLGSNGVRLLTLTGPGGIGKTRIALQAAAHLVDCFEDGVYFVNLAPIQDPSDVPAAIAQSLDLRVSGEQPLLDELRENLQSKRMLLLLDNFEQVIPAAAGMAELLQGSPRLKIMVTSRETLHLRGEQIFPIQPLELPDLELENLAPEQLSRYEAVQLFIDRARAANPDFKLTGENLQAVAEICTRLDGLPLAIELAAARTRLFSPRALLERLGSRLALLRGGARDLPARQQALENTIGWSYELLDPGEQRLFELLSVFQGATIEAVEAVVAAIDAQANETLEASGLDVLEGLASLVEKSLLRQVDRGPAEPRLHMLETIREFAAARLGKDPAFAAMVRRAHADYFAGFTRTQWARLTGYEREAAITELSAELENVHAAWRYWVAEKDLERLGKFVDSLWLLYDARGWYHVAIDLATDLLDVLSSTPSSPELANQEIMLRTSLARALWAIKGYTAQTEQAFNQALELSRSVGDIPELFPVLRGTAAFYLLLGEYGKSVGLGERILNLATKYDDAGMRVEGHLVLGTNHIFLDDIALGLKHLEQGIQLFDPDRYLTRRFWLGNNPGVACHTISALVLFWLGYPDRSLERANAAITLARRLNHPYSMAYAMFHMGFLHIWRREFAHSHEYAQAVLEIAGKHEFRIWQAVATCLNGAALAATGNAEQGIAEIRQGSTLYRGLKTPPIFWPLLLYLQAGAYSRQGRNAEGLALLQETPRTTEKAFGEVLAGELIRFQGELLLAHSPGNRDQAEAAFNRALEAARTHQAPLLELRTAMNLARLWEGDGKGQQGLSLLRAAYGKITEGHDLADVQEARALLDKPE